MTAEASEQTAGARARGRSAARVAAYSGALVALVVVALVVVEWDSIAAWYRFRTLFAPLGRNAQGHDEYEHRETGIAFVAMPAGRFAIGSDADELDSWENERPRHEVELSAFLIAKYEVTQEEWGRVTGESPAAIYGRGLPVDSVSWHDCVKFCELAGFALPTEAQWERACRAGTTTPFAFGEAIDSEQVNFNGTRPYGSSRPSEFRRTLVRADALEPNGAGLHNVHGNVAEWCRDVYDEDWYEKLEATDRDPISRGGSGQRSIRGGGWYSQARHCRSAARSFEDPSYRGRSVGFRPVWESGTER